MQLTCVCFSQRSPEKYNEQNKACGPSSGEEDVRKHQSPRTIELNLPQLPYLGHLGQWDLIIVTEECTQCHQLLPRNK